MAIQRLSQRQLRPMRTLVQFVLSACLAYIAFAVLGVLTAPGFGSPLSPDEAVAALSFSFPEVNPDWKRPAGNASHGWLFRRAYVEGYAGSIVEVRYSEQVLKVGWPFTVVRAFVRTTNNDLTPEGAAWVGPFTPGRPVRVLPVQPVWPGLMVYGFLGAAVVAGIGRARHRSKDLANVGSPSN